MKSRTGRRTFFPPGIPGLVLAACIALPSLAVHALSSDSEQPMYIEADRADIDDKQGVSVYTGNVKVTQGTFRLLADKLTVHIRNNEIQKAVAIGNPARYKQRPDGKDEDIEAEARQMEYYAAPERIVLIDKAVASQGGDEFRSDKIVYDIQKDIVNAGTGDSGSRVHITLQPRNNKDTPEETVEEKPESGAP